MAGWTTRQRARPGRSPAVALIVSAEDELASVASGCRELVELAEQLALELEALGCAFLHVDGTGERVRELGVGP